ncbi:MAG TPA: hypothetical protein VIV11_01910 [Kofleriaceae bacterium]
MRRLLLLAALAACDSGTPKQTPAPPPPRGDAAAVDAMALIPSPDAIASAPHPLSMTTPVWIGRRYLTGAVRATQTHETFTLQFAGGEALLRVAKRHAKSSLDDVMSEPRGWSEPELQQYIGTIKEDGDVVTIAVEGNDKIDWKCKRTKVAAARADAVRGRTPGSGGEECGDTGRWVPATTKQVPVIRCIPFAEPKPNDPDGAGEVWEKLAFAEDPGIEWLHVNDDCVIQGGGWRLVAPDRAIAKVRERR